MIFEWFVDAALGFVEWLLELMPFADDTIDLGALAPAIGLMYAFDGILPITAMFQGFLVILTLAGALFVVRIVLRLVSHIPAIGGAG